MKSHFTSNSSHDLTYDCCQTRLHPLLHFQTLSDTIQMFTIMCFWAIATNWRGTSDEAKWRDEKWEREWIIWTSRASPQELMHTICLLALIYAPSLHRWSISRSTTRHVCMALRSKPNAGEPYENNRTCYITFLGARTRWTSGHSDEPLQQLWLDFFFFWNIIHLKSLLPAKYHWKRCLEITPVSVTDSEKNCQGSFMYF